MLRTGSNDIYFTALGRKDRDSSVSQSRFGAWRYPNSENSGNSGYIRDIKTGIFIEGFDGELVVCALMESKNDKPALYENYSNKTASARLDFWALFADVSGDVQYRRLRNS